MYQSAKNTRQSRSIFHAGKRSTVCRLAVLIMAGSLASGCSYLQRDHIEVGAVPDDYRTNHPIVISEQEQVTDIPFGMTEEKLTEDQKIMVHGFLDGYEPASGAIVQVMLPSGSANERNVSNRSHELLNVINQAGVPRHKIVVVHYQAAAATAAPVRLSYTKVAASAGQCGRWPDDILKASENKHYANFGCSYQNNLAAQVANPADLLGPRKPSEIDAERRVIAIGKYREGGQAVRGDTNFNTP